MTTFFMTFNIVHEGDYDRVAKPLDKALRSKVVECWRETPSLYVLRYTGKVQEFCDRVFAEAKMRKTKDSLLAFAMEGPLACIGRCGVIRDHQTLMRCV